MNVRFCWRYEAFCFSPLKDSPIVRLYCLCAAVFFSGLLCIFCTVLCLEFDLLIVIVCLCTRCCLGV